MGSEPPNIGSAGLAHILGKAREAADLVRPSPLSTGEALAAALVLNRPDWLAAMNFTIAEAIERIGPEWARLIPAAAKHFERDSEKAAYASAEKARRALLAEITSRQAGDKVVEPIYERYLRRFVATAIKFSCFVKRRTTFSERYRAEGPTGLISRHCSRPSNNRLDASLEAKVVKILRESYPDFGPTLASEKLQQRHGITAAKETLRRVQMDAGLWIPRKLRPPTVQQPRHGVRASAS